MRQKKKKISLSNRLFYIFNTIFWVVVMFIILYPLYLVVIASVSDPNAVTRGEVIWRPVDFSLIGYKSLGKYKDFFRSYGNSLYYTAAGVSLSIAVTLSAAYVLSRPKFTGKKFLSVFFVVTMFFGGGLIPTFLLMRDLGLYNTRLILILSGCIGTWNLMVARTFIQTSIPSELYEAAVLDGASHFNYFFRVVVPLSKTIVGVLAVYYGVSKWNAYYTGLVYIRDRKLLPLQTVLREILASLQVDWSSPYMTDLMDNTESVIEAMRIANVAKYCIIVVSTVPVVILYGFTQKYFEKGVMIGSLKG